MSAGQGNFTQFGAQEIKGLMHLLFSFGAQFHSWLASLFLWALPIHPPGQVC